MPMRSFYLAESLTWYSMPTTTIAPVLRNGTPP
jgi:hypothetical protein